MREISTQKRIKVIKLFLTGLSYDEIARQVGIAKGSVVHIINEFREGYLPVPPDMTEYVDALRQVAVDLRKNNTSIAQVKSCLRLDAKLTEMGVSNEEAEQCLDICQDIASPTASTGQFVKAALELARLASESGLSYGDLIADYNAKLNRSKELDKEIEQEGEQLTKVKLKHKEEKERATKELDSITSSIHSAEEAFHQQVEDQRLRLVQFQKQYQLDWEKVNAAVALFDTELGKAGLSKKDRDTLRRQVAKVGSLVNFTYELERERVRLQMEVDSLAKREKSHAARVQEFRRASDDCCQTLSSVESDVAKLEEERKSREAELKELKQTTCKHKENLYISDLILRFLSEPDSVSDYDLQRFIGMMIAFREARSGKGPKQVTDGEGNVVCQCEVPKVWVPALSKEDIDHARTYLARLIATLVRDRFVHSFEYDELKRQHKYELVKADMNARLDMVRQRISE